MFHILLVTFEFQNLILFSLFFREFLNKEISLYNHFHSVPYEINADFQTKVLDIF